MIEEFQYFKLIFDENYVLTQYFDKVANKTHSLTQQFFYYIGFRIFTWILTSVHLGMDCRGSRDDNTLQASGAYAFRPNGAEVPIGKPTAHTFVNVSTFRSFKFLLNKSNMRFVLGNTSPRDASAVR